MFDISRKRHYVVWCAKCGKKLGQTIKPVQVGAIMNAHNVKPTRFLDGKCKNGEEIKCRCGSLLIKVRYRNGDYAGYTTGGSMITEQIIDQKLKEVKKVIVR